MIRIDKQQVLIALFRHIGRGNGTSARELVIEICGRSSTASERTLREAIVQLRLDGHHVCGHPNHGYYLAKDDAELDATCTFLYDRAMTSLTQISAMKRVSLPDLRGQLKLPT